MSVYRDVIEAVLRMVNDIGLYAPATIGPLPPDNGISIAWGSGAVATTFQDKRACISASLVVNAKHRDPTMALDALSNIHVALTMTRDYPVTDNYQITNIETSSPPTYLGREENSQWLYGSSITVKFFLKGD